MTAAGSCSVRLGVSKVNQWPGFVVRKIRRDEVPVWLWERQNGDQVWGRCRVADARARVCKDQSELGGCFCLAGEVGCAFLLWWWYLPCVMGSRLLHHKSTTEVESRQRAVGGQQAGGGRRWQKTSEKQKEDRR